MAFDKECEAYARECVRLANLCTDPRLRESLMQMAREWMAMAMGERPTAAARPGLLMRQMAHRNQFTSFMP